MSSKRSTTTAANSNVAVAAPGAASSTSAANVLPAGPQTRSGRQSTGSTATTANPATTVSAAAAATAQTTSSQSRSSAVPPPNSQNDEHLIDLTETPNLKSETLMQRIKKRPISGVLHTESDAELTCPICFDLIDIAHVTRCGHSFCQMCIQTALEHTHRCPKCNTPCSMQKDVFPNFALNQIVEKFKEETNFKKCKVSQGGNPPNLLDLLATNQEDLDLDSVNQLIRLLASRKEELNHSNKKVIEMLLYDFLKHLHQTKTEELNRIQYELQVVNEDCKLVEDCLKSLKVNTVQLNDGAVSSKSGVKVEQLDEVADSNSNDQNLSNLNANSQQQQAQLPSNTSEPNQAIEKVINQTPTSANLMPDSPLTAFLQSTDQKMQSILNTKKRVVHRYFDELSQTYVQAHNRDYKDFNLQGTSNESAQVSASSSSPNQHNNSALDQIRQTVSKMTHYNEFKNIASVNYNSDMYATSSIVSSVDFDRSYEHFAMAGVTKRIKIFDFQNIIERPTSGVHYPLYEMTHTAKLSCVNWNRYFRQQLACSDYDGVVTLWDAEQGKCVQSFQEHEKRCWGVQFCEVDPRLLASGSDDSKVKIWSTSSDYSLMSIDAKSNVCCVIFKPESKYHVLFGTADHTIHYYDIRNPKEPVALFKGHKKAVSYVKFTSDNEFVSASTDSTLKMWKLNEGQCVRTYTGHTNEKNFVGLDTRNGYVVTGSENNTVFLYANELSKPLMTYKFDDVAQTAAAGAAGATAGNVKKDEGVNDFVSAVCWSNQNHLLAANSQGVCKILELV